VTLKAFIKVHAVNPRTELYFVGHATNDIPLVQKVKHEIEINNLSECVHIVGYDTNPYRWDKFADCFVSTSRIEGLPNVLIEAQYLGIPAVATECIPMISRIITNGITGFTVPVDDIDAIADAMMKAPKLGRIKMTYKPASKDDFIELFNEVKYQRI
jgi:glycosyltransferase involved in cell wall biosynthesis